MTASNTSVKISYSLLATGLGIYLHFLKLSVPLAEMIMATFVSLSSMKSVSTYKMIITRLNMHKEHRFTWWASIGDNFKIFLHSLTQGLSPKDF